MLEHKKCWDYQDQDARVKIPVFPLEISVDKLKEEYDFLIDTGFDGYLLIPYTTYKKFKLYQYELPPDLWSYGESISGELKPLRCSRALVKNQKIGFAQIVEIETFEHNEQNLIGLGLLKRFQTLLLGDKEQLCLSLV